MKQVVIWIKNSLQLSYAEAKNTLYFFGLILFLALTVILSKSIFHSANRQIIISEYNPEIITFKEKQNFSSNQNNDTYKVNEKLITFNPNTASAEELRAGGLSNFAASNLLKYRNKGAIFKYKEDLSKVFGIDAGMFQKIFNFIELPSRAENDNNHISNREAIYGVSGIEPAYKVKTEVESFDINTANETQLMSLEGIGEVFAKRIINYRNKLGGFNNFEQIKGTYGITEEAISSLESKTFLGSTVTKFKINKVDAKSFKHPTLKNYQWKVVFSYRDQHKGIKGIEDLAKIKVLSSNDIKNVSPYIDFEPIE